MSTVRRSRETILLVTAALWATACADGSVNGPVTTERRPPMAVNYSWNALDRVPLLTRTPRDQPVTVQKHIDASGGWLSVDGVMLVIPERALGPLNSSVLIKMTIPAGNELRVVLEPHGLQFRKPVLVAFGLNDTGIDPSRAMNELIGVYFQGQPTGGAVLPSEWSSVFLYGGSAAFQIQHFSNYGIAKGLILVGG